MKLLIAFLAGLLMSAGMAVSMMIDPQKVLGFLTLNANWDPSLAFVMAGALIVYSSGYYLVTKRPAPLFDKSFYLPSRTGVDKPLLIGAAVFGIGWGLVGYCPGPAISALSSFSMGTISFVLAMIAGWFVAGKLKIN